MQRACYHQPSPESVAAMVEIMQLTGEEPGVRALGGLPRACERFLNRHRNEGNNAVANAAKHMREALESREAYGLDASGINSGCLSDDVRQRVGREWTGYWVGTSPSGCSIAHFALGDLKVKELCKRFSDDELRDFFLTFHCRGSPHCSQ